MTPWRTARAPGRWLGALVASLGLAACAAQPPGTGSIPPLRNQPVFDAPQIDLLGMSSEMQAFVDAYVLSPGHKANRAWSLLYAALDPYLLAFHYDPSVTRTARRAFETRRGNCLTFSNMFIAMARSAGLEAWYEEVQTPPQWNAVSDTMLVSMHVNAVVRDHNREYIIDVSRRRQSDTDRRRRISDGEAAAQFYNNLGAEALVDGRLAEADAWFRRALETDAGLPYVWSNLGVVFKRNGQTKDAQQAYETALRIDPRHSVSLNNLYVIYTEAGELEAAQALRERVEKIRRNNPFYLDFLAQTATGEQRYDDAIDLAKRAIRLAPREYRFHYTLARAQQQAGLASVALASLERAQRLAPESAGTLTLDSPSDGF
ncbi:MAG: tetratricopeptide repeat protein [Lysobacterales bacterium]|jgi:tetratricopeptide (TPR) repeat protein